MKPLSSKLVLTCTGSVADEDLEERLAKITTTLQVLSQTDNDAVNLSKIEPWNSVRVTFNIPPEAAARLRELAQQGDPNLHKLGILTVQVENGETIALPPPRPEAQGSLFLPPPSTLSGMPQLPPGPPIVPPSPTPVVSPIIPVSTPTPGPMVSGHCLGGLGTGPNFSMPGVSLQQLTRPSLHGIQAPGSAPLFPQQGAANLWNSLGVPQQCPPPASFWNQIPQFFPRANQPHGMPSGPPIPPVQQPKPQPKKRRKRTKKANIQPPELAVAAGQPLLPLPPHLQSLPPSNTNTQDNVDNFSTNKPSNLTLPPSLIDNPISPNTPPSTALATSSTATAPVVASSSSNPGTQFSFTDIPMSRGLVPSPQTQQQLLKKADVALTSPLLVNLLQSDISAKQFPFSTTGSKTTSTGTNTPTGGHPGLTNQELSTTLATGINTSSPFMLGNGLSTLATPNTVIPNMPQVLTSQGNILSHISSSGQFLPPNTVLQAQSGQLSQEQVQFQLSQLSAAQLSQAQAQHVQSFPGHVPQSPMMPGQNQMQPDHKQPFQVPGSHYLQGPLFPGPMPHNQLPNVRMSIGPITTQDPMSQGQMRLGGPTYMGHMLRGPMPTEHAPFQPNDPSLNQGKGQLQPNGQFQTATLPFVSLNNAPFPPSVNPMDTWTPVPSSSVTKEKEEMQIDSVAKKSVKLSVPDSGIPQPGPTLKKPANNSKTPDLKPPEEAAHVFDEEAALLGMTEAERDTMAVAAIIAKEAKMAADAKNGKQAQIKDLSPPKCESQPAISTASTPTTIAPSIDGSTASTPHQPTITPGLTLTKSFPESQQSRPSSRGGPSMPSVADRRSSNSPVRLSPPKMPDSVKQRRTPPSSVSRPIHHQQPHYGPIPGSSQSSMSSGIMGLQTLTSRTFSASAQPSIRDMALSRNSEHNTLSQFLSSVTPPTEILQMAPLFRSSKQQDTPPKSMPGFLPGPTAAPNEWLPLPTVDTQKPLPLPSQIGARTPMQPAEFSAATERMLGSMLDTQKPGLSNIERPPNQPRVITKEGINFMHKLVGRAPPSNPQNQGQSKDAATVIDNPQAQTNPCEQAKNDDKSQLKALLNEVVISEKCPYEKQLLTDDTKIAKPPTTSESAPTDSLSSVRQPNTIPPVTLQQVEQWLGFSNPAMSLAQAAARKADSISQSSNITSIYIPPPVMGQQQHQVIFNQPLTPAQQATLNCNIASSAPALETTHLGSTTSESGTEVEGSRSQLDKAFTLASPSLFPSQPVCTLPQVGDDTTAIFTPQEFFPHQVAESLIRDSSAIQRTSHRQLPKLSFSPSRFSKLPISQQPSLQETPMTVLERAPQILLSPATLSTASQELIMSLGAHGTITTVPPTSEMVPAAKDVTEQEKSHVPEKPAQQLQELTTQEPVDETCSQTVLPQSILEGAHFSADSSVAQLQAAVPEISAHEITHPSITHPSSTPVMHLQAEEKVQYTEVNGVASEVVTTATELVAPHSPLVPITPFDRTVVTNITAPSAPVQRMSEVSDLEQKSKIPLSQLVAEPLTSQQSPESQPETSIPSMQPASLITQQPSAQKPTVLQETFLPAEECENVISPSQVPESVQKLEALRLQPSNLQPSFSLYKSSPEKALKSSPEKLKQLELEMTSKSIESEADKIAQHLYKKALADKRPTQQQLRTSPGSVASFGYPSSPQATTTSPTVKPVAFSSASSTLAQAQSIMVKTAAMSRTSGIMKAAEQTTRPVRSRTPPRASLSTLPPNTCNNESLGSASALLSSIAKSAWTVTTAMASAAKAKVVPTPKAPDKNLTRTRRSPETLPPAGKTAAGERDRGSSIHDAPNQQSRTLLGPTTVKHTSKTPSTESFIDAAQPVMRSQEGSLPSKSSIQPQPPYPEEKTAGTVVPASDTSVTIFSGGAIQHIKPPATCSFPFGKLESEYLPIQPLSYHRASSSRSAVPSMSSAPRITPFIAKSEPITGLESTTQQRDSSEDENPALHTTAQVQQQILLSTDTHNDAESPPKTSKALPSPDENSKHKSFEEEALKADQKVPVECDSNLVSFPKALPVTDIETTIPGVIQGSTLDPLQEKSQIVCTGIPVGPPTTSLRDTAVIPAVETQHRLFSTSMPALEGKEPLEDIQMKLEKSQPELIFPAPSNETAAERGSTVLATVPQAPGTSWLTAEPVYVIPTYTAAIKRQVPQPSVPGSTERSHTGDSEEPPAKQARIAPTHISQACHEVKYLYQQEEAKKELSTPIVGVDLPTLDASIGKNNAPKMPTAHETASELATKVAESSGHFGQLRGKQEAHLPVDTEISLRDKLKALGTEVVKKPDPVPSSERIGGNVTGCMSGSSVHQHSFQSLEVSVTVQTDISPESSLLNKPEQITNLVEKVIQIDPDLEASLHRCSSSSVLTEPTSSELSRQETSEPLAAKSTEAQIGQSRKTDTDVKPPDREQSREGGFRMGKELEGDFEQRRTRYTSEEGPGMSTRSLRSGRRSPGEPSSRGKEKEESPPTTRGRGQKEKEFVGESEADALSKKRSTRSSGRDMYYGPIPSYKRRKINQK